MASDRWTAEDVERVARAMKVEFGTAEGWDKAPDWIRVEFRESAVTVLAALADAGRLRSDEDQQAEARVRAQVATEIRAELVCCDVYDQDADTERAGKRHAICFWGEAAARIAEPAARRHSGTGADT